VKTVFNPVEAIRFATWLKEESGVVMDDLRNTTKIMTELRANWNDPKYDEYLRAFDGSTKSFAEFKQHVEAYISYLRKKADIVTEFLG